MEADIDLQMNLELPKMKFPSYGWKTRERIKCSTTKKFARKFQKDVSKKLLSLCMFNVETWNLNVHLQSQSLCVAFKVTFVPCFEKFKVDGKLVTSKVPKKKGERNMNLRHLEASFFFSVNINFRLIFCATDFFTRKKILLIISRILR